MGGFNFGENWMNGLGGVQKVNFFVNSKWQTASSAHHGLTGMIVLGLSHEI